MKSRIWCLLALVALTGCAAGVSDATSNSDDVDDVAEADAPIKVKPAATEAAREQGEAAVNSAKPDEYLCAACGPSPQPWQERPAMDPAR